MSFGISTGDVILVAQLGWQVVQGARQACGEHDELTREVTSLHRVLEQLRHELSNPESPVNRIADERRKDLADNVAGCETVLKIVDLILTKYNALGDDKRSGKKLWQKVKFGNGEMKDLVDIRLKISTHTSAITMALNLMSLGSQGRIERQLSGQRGELQGIRESVNWITAKMTASSNEGSVLTSYTNDDRAFWKGLRRELVREGYPSSVLHMHKHVIKAYVKELADRGVLDEIGDRCKELNLESNKLKARKEPLDERIIGRENVHNASDKRSYDVNDFDGEESTVKDSSLKDQPNTRKSMPSVQIEEVLDEDFAPYAHPNIETIIEEAIEHSDAYPILEHPNNDSAQRIDEEIECIVSLVNPQRRFILCGNNPLETSPEKPSPSRKPSPFRNSSRPKIRFPWPPGDLPRVGTLSEIRKQIPNAYSNRLPPLAAADYRSRLDFENDIRSIGNPFLPSDVPLLTPRDLEKFPDECSLRYWDPRRKPLITIENTVFDIYSITAWICFCSATFVNGNYDPPFIALQFSRAARSLNASIVLLGRKIDSRHNFNPVDIAYACGYCENLRDVFIDLIKSATPTWEEKLAASSLLINFSSRVFVDLPGRALVKNLFSQGQPLWRAKDFIDIAFKWCDKVKVNFDIHIDEISSRHPASPIYIYEGADDNWDLEESQKDNSSDSDLG